jgi:hypothetical protein
MQPANPLRAAVCRWSRYFFLAEVSRSTGAFRPGDNLDIVANRVKQANRVMRAEIAKIVTGTPHCVCCCLPASDKTTSLL